MLNGVLYKRGFLLPYLRCIEKDESKYIMKELHEGIYRDHMGARSLVGKFVSVDYFWPTMQKEAKEFVKKSDKY